MLKSIFYESFYERSLLFHVHFPKINLTHARNRGLNAM